jgi:anti-sigma factor RsiW
MISCRDAKHLFDRYLDGRLSGSLQTELHAHRLACTACQNELALLEAIGDVVAIDRREPTVSASFTDRVLLANRIRRRPIRPNWSRRVLAFGSPVAAAACLALTISISSPLRPPTDVKGIQVDRNSLMARPAAAQAGFTPGSSAPSLVDDLLAPLARYSVNLAQSAGSGVEGLLESFHETISSAGDPQFVQSSSSSPLDCTEPVGPPTAAMSDCPPDDSSRQTW